MVGASEAEQQDNPEFLGVTLAPDLPARKRRLLLRSATTRMKAAAEGRDLALEDSGELRVPAIGRLGAQATPAACSAPPSVIHWGPPGTRIHICQQRPWVENNKGLPLETRRWRPPNTLLSKSGELSRVDSGNGETGKGEWGSVG